MQSHHKNELQLAVLSLCLSIRDHYSRSMYLNRIITGMHARDNIASRLLASSNVFAKKLANLSFHRECATLYQHKDNPVHLLIRLWNLMSTFSILIILQ